MLLQAMLCNVSCVKIYWYDDDGDNDDDVYLRQKQMLIELYVTVNLNLLDSISIPLK